MSKLAELFQIYQLESADLGAIRVHTIPLDKVEAIYAQYCRSRDIAREIAALLIAGTY